MKSALLVCFVLSCSLLPAQQPGVASIWETSENIGQFATGAARLKPLLEQMKPQEWMAQGASQTYMTQWEGTRLELDYLEQASKLFQTDPQRLTAALDTYFRWQNVEFRMESLIEAVRKYQNPAVGDLILNVLRSNSANRDGLRNYIAQLADLKEREALVNEEEAQRCRADLVRPAPAQPRTSPAKGNTQSKGSTQK